MKTILSRGILAGCTVATLVLILSGWSADPPVKRALDDLHQSDPAIRRRALAFLRMSGVVTLGDAAQVIPLLNDDNEKVRLEAARVLGRTRNPAAIAPLTALARRDAGIRADIVRELRRFRHPAALAALREFLHDPDKSVRTRARKGVESLVWRFPAGATGGEPNNPFYYSQEELFASWLLKR